VAAALRPLWAGTCYFVPAKAYKGLRWLADPSKGVFAGYYETTQQPNRALTLNTNGIILEALLYNQAGKPLEAWAHEAH
jgi:Protein of unknown function (DUF3131)